MKRRTPFSPILSLAGAALFAVSSGMDAADPIGASAAGARLRTITVVGQGEARGRPDVARTAIGIEAIGPKVAPTIDEANSRMRAVLEAVKRSGIREKDIRTTDFSIYFEQNPTPPRPAAKNSLPAGNYHVRNSVEVTIRDLRRASDVLDGAIAAGANTVSGISFTVDDPAPLRAKAREAAVGDARARAEALARASGVGVGPVVSISESFGGGPRPMATRSLAMTAGPPIESGESSETAEVEVVYEIVPAAGSQQR